MEFKFNDRVISYMFGWGTVSSIDSFCEYGDPSGMTVTFDNMDNNEWTRVQIYSKSGHLGSYKLVPDLYKGDDAPDWLKDLHKNKQVKTTELVIKSPRSARTSYERTLRSLYNEVETKTSEALNCGNMYFVFHELSYEINIKIKSREL